MGCACSKNKRPTGFTAPAGSGARPGGSTAESANARNGEARRVNTQPSGPTQSFTLKTNDGRTMTFGSKLEAEAAKIRSGGGQVF